MDWQLIAVGVIMAAALAHIIWRVWRAARRGGRSSSCSCGCSGCSLADKCADKKQPEKH
ncbi:MAG: FeoB-associated Cys-rich membrane protein [Muribaculaceae bacterium]|nr:FeoB-associated Cys-rich membrane protein [Muribaculaceae bacterium]